MKLIVGKDW